MAQTIIERYRRTGLHFVEELGNTVQLEMVLIKGDVFTMGAPETEEGSSDDERPQHEVTIQTFFMGKYPVTQAQWRAVAALPQINRKLETDPSSFKGDKRPVERVSWYDAVEFCDRLSSHTKRQYRLPSEAEWEYACRAGTTRGKSSEELICRHATAEKLTQIRFQKKISIKQHQFVIARSYPVEKCRKG